MYIQRHIVNCPVYNLEKVRRILAPSLGNCKNKTRPGEYTDKKDVTSYGKHLQLVLFPLAFFGILTLSTTSGVKKCFIFL